MFHFCTTIDAALQPVRALHASLIEQTADNFELTVLAFDEGSAKALAAQPLPQVRVLPLDELVALAPGLSAARADRTEAEFQQTCQPWLMAHLLDKIPAGEVLIHIAPSLYFFSSPQAILDELGGGSMALCPYGYAGAFSTRDRFGRFDPGLICVRHDTTGTACAADWKVRCAAWCFAQLEHDRYGAQKYLDAWGARFSGTVCMQHPGINVAPWNLAARRLTVSGSGLQVDDRPLVCFQFHGLAPLSEGLYDPGLAGYEVVPDELLRDHIYQPYLQQLGHGGPANSPDIVPPRRADDPRSGLVLAQLLQQTGRVRAAQAMAERALEKLQRESALAIADHRALEASTARYLSEIEADRAAQRQELIDVKGKLLKAYDDIYRYVDAQKELANEIAALRADKDEQIARLASELALRTASASWMQEDDVRQALAPYGRKCHRLVVLKYHPRLLPEILWLAAMGVQVEVLASPPEMADGNQGPVRFRPQTAWEWLGQIESLFNENAYLHANPDVAQAVAQGAVASGWDHYVRFGQREFRHPGSGGYCTGLAEFDAVAFDGTDAPALVPLLAGRLQPQNRLFISGFVPPTDWLPAEEDRTYVLGTTLVCERPPKDWLGPRQPANGLACHLPAVDVAQLYPELPAQRAYWPGITIVTVNFNQAARLEETMRSVLDQNYPKTEYIVVDGGSTDGSLEIIRRHASRVILLETRHGANLTRALNEGLGKATGGIVSWLNVGDRLAPGSLYTVGQTFLMHKTDLVAGRCARVRGDEVLPWQIHRTCLPLDRIAALSLRDLLDLDGAWLKDCFFNQPEVFLRREIFDRAGGRLREELAASRDYDLWVRLAKVGAQAFALPEILAISRGAGGPGADYRDLAELGATNGYHRQSDQSA
jgi:hypothetical protein